MWKDPLTNPSFFNIVTTPTTTSTKGVHDPRQDENNVWVITQTQTQDWVALMSKPIALFLKNRLVR